MEASHIKKIRITELPGIKLLLVASALIFVFYIFLVYNNYSSDVKAAELAEKNATTEKLLGEIYLHNETATSSAKLYASTSIDTWQKRYGISKDKLKQAIKNAVELLPQQEQNSFSSKLDEITGKLEEIENLAFARVASGNAPEADSLLNTSEYEENKNLYEATIKNLADTLKTNLDKEQRGNTFNKTFFNAVGALSFLIMVILAVSAMARTAKFVTDTFEAQNKKIAESEKEMKAILEKQLETNEQLSLAQKQMQEKNAELEKAKQTTEKLLREQEEANKKLILAQRELQKTLAEQNRTNQKLIEAQKELTQKAQELERSEREARALAEAQLEANEQLFLAQRKAEEALKQEEKTKQELVLSAQKQDVLNKILQKSIATNSSNLKEFFDFTIDTLSEVRFLELLPGVGIFTKKSGDVYEMIAQKNISPKIQELCHNIKAGQCLCGLAIKMKETQYAHCVDERHTTRFEGIKEHGHYNIPILYQDEALGALVVYLPHGHKRDQSEIDFLEAVCNIIANTIIAVRKEQELERSERELRALAEAQLEANEQLFLAQRKMQEAQKELQVVTERLDLAIAGTNDGIWDWDIANNKVYFSPRWKSMLGYEDDELENSFETFVSLQHPEDAPIVKKNLEDYLAGKTDIYSLEIRMKTKSGDYKWILTRGLALRDAEGKPYRMAGSHTDITERKQAELEIKRLLEMQTAINDTLMLAQQELAQKAQELERSERELRALAEAQLEANEQLFLAQRKMQEAQKELQRLSLVASKTDNAVIISDANGLIEWVNEGFEKLTEYKLEEVKGKKPGAFLQGHETNPADVQAVREGLASRKPFYCEIYNYSKSGKGYWLGLNITPIFDESGNLTQFIAIETDITERKQAELEKQIRAEKLEKYNQILNKLSLAPYEHYGSLENAYKTLTEALAEGLGVERASIWKYNGESIISEDLYEKSLNKHSAGVELFAKDFPAYFEAISSGISIVAENAHTHPSTFEFSEVYLSPLGINSMLDVPIRIEGELKGVICCEYVGKDYKKWTQEDENFVRSVSDVVALFVEADKRKKAQEEIKELLEIQTAINDTLMLAQQELAQKAHELERSEREMRALAEAQLEANEKLMLAQKEAQEALLKAKKAEQEMRLLAEAQLEANEKLMLAEKQLKEALEIEKKQKAELDRLVAQLKETQGQLVHNEKMASLGQLTAGIAHEINNPINFVYNGIDTLKISLDDLMEIVNKYNELDNANGNKDAVIEEAKRLKQQLGFEELTQDIEHLVADIKRGAVRTMEIVKGLRVFSRLDEEERKMASIKECLEATLILLNNKMKGRIQLKKYYDETMPEIMCYPGQLNQVFMNIINNAIQAIPEDRKDGEISIYTENQQENVIIRIKDNGIGMSEQVKRRIFEPFFTTKPVGVGTGLGLSITFGIIEKHGGNIFVNSEEGKGTEFVIQLPKQKT